MDLDFDLDGSTNFQGQLEAEVTTPQSPQPSRMTSREKHRRKMDRIWRKDLHNTAGRQAASSRMYGMDKKHLKWMRKQKKEREMRQRKLEPESSPAGGADVLDEAALEAGNAYGFDIDFGTGTQVSHKCFVLY